MARHNLPLFDIENNQQKQLLRQQAEPVNFPLSTEDKELIETMKYMTAEGLGSCAGLAAPQVGVSRRIIVYHVTEEAQHYRDDADTLIPLSVLINPSYEAVGENKRLDWEGCFSVQAQMGKVPRYTTIRYKGQDEEGNPVEGTAEGFLARLLQHEIDHLNGILICDLFDPHSPHGAREEMKHVRQQEQRGQ